MNRFKTSLMFSLTALFSIEAMASQFDAPPPAYNEVAQQPQAQTMHAQNPVASSSPEERRIEDHIRSLHSSEALAQALQASSAKSQKVEAYNKNLEQMPKNNPCTRARFFYQANKPFNPASIILGCPCFVPCIVAYICCGTSSYISCSDQAGRKKRMGYRYVGNENDSWIHGYDSKGQDKWNS